MVLNTVPSGLVSIVFSMIEDDWEQLINYSQAASAKLISSCMWHENMIIQHSGIYRYKLKHIFLGFIVQVKGKCVFI